LFVRSVFFELFHFKAVLTVFALKIAKKSKNGPISLKHSSIDAELNGEHFIPAHQHTLSDDLYEFFAFKVYRKVSRGQAASRAPQPA